MKFCCSIFKDRSVSGSSPYRTAYLLYPNAARLSSTFQNFFKFLPADPGSLSEFRPFFRAAFVVYHPFFLLSRGFFKFFLFFPPFSPEKKKADAHRAGRSPRKPLPPKNAEPPRFLPRRPPTPKARAARHTVLSLALCRNHPLKPRKRASCLTYIKKGGLSRALRRSKRRKTPKKNRNPTFFCFFKKVLAFFLALCYTTCVLS